MLHRNDGHLRRSSMMAALLWALNNLLIGAETAAALSVLSAGRTATSVALARKAARLRAASCGAFMLLALAIALATWEGLPSALTATASLMSTWAMFYFAGVRLRLVLLVGAVLWLAHALIYGSWEQAFAQVLAIGASAYGAWRIERTTRRPPAPASL